jgi:hypothetical protein
MDEIKLKLIHYDILNLQELYEYKKSDYGFINDDTKEFTIKNLTYKGIAITELLKDIIY